MDSLSSDHIDIEQETIRALINKTGALQWSLLKTTHKVVAMRSNILFVSVLMLFSFAAIAEVPLNQADILDTWQIDKISMQSDGSKSRGLNSYLDF